MTDSQARQLILAGLLKSISMTDSGPVVNFHKWLKEVGKGGLSLKSPDCAEEEDCKSCEAIAKKLMDNMEDSFVLQLVHEIHKTEE